MNRGEEMVGSILVVLSSDESSSPHSAEMWSPEVL